MKRTLLLILAVAVFSRLLCYAGFTGAPDAFKNAEIVNQIVTGPWPTQKDAPVAVVFPVRIGFLGVTAAFVKLLGYSEISLILYPFLASLLTVVLVYFLGRMWIGEKGALVGAFLYAVFPLDLVFSTQIYSDPPLTFLCVLSAFLFFLSYGKPEGRQRSLLFLLSGLVIGFAYLHKVTAGYYCLMFAMFGFLEMARKKRILWDYGLLLLGFLSVFCVEMAFQYHVNQDPLYRWHVYIMQADNVEGREAFGEAAGGIVGTIKRLFWAFPINCLLSLKLGFFYWFIFPAFVYCLLRRRKELWVPLLWWTLIAVLLNLSSFKGYRLPFYGRLTFLMSVPGVILLAQMLCDLLASCSLRSRKARVSVLVLFVTLALLSSLGFAGFLLFQEPILEAVAKPFKLKSLPLPQEMLEMFLGLLLPFILFATLFLALFFCGLFLAGWLRERKGQTTWAPTMLAVGVAGFLAISSVSLACGSNRFIPKFERDAFKVLRDLPTKKIYVDTKTRETLRFYFGFTEEERLVDFSDVPLHSVRDGYLVYNTVYKDVISRFSAFWSKRSPYFHSYPDIHEEVAEGWEIIASIYGGKVVIYRIP